MSYFKQSGGNDSDSDSDTELKKKDEEDNEEENEEDEREGSRLDEEVWEFKKGNMRVSSDMPYEGNLSGDEDGDF